MYLYIYIVHTIPYSSSWEYTYTIPYSSSWEYTHDTMQ